MAAPMTRLTMCDSSDEQIVAVSVCVAGIARRRRRQQRRPTAVRFATANTWGITSFGARGGNRRPSKPLRDLDDGKYDVTQPANRKASLPRSQRTNDVQRMQIWTCTPFSRMHSQLIQIKSNLIKYIFIIHNRIKQQWICFFVPLAMHREWNEVQDV